MGLRASASTNPTRRPIFIHTRTFSDLSFHNLVHTSTSLDFSQIEMHIPFLPASYSSSPDYEPHPHSPSFPTPYLSPELCPPCLKQLHAEATIAFAVEEAIFRQQQNVHNWTNAKWLSERDEWRERRMEVVGLGYGKWWSGLNGCCRW